MGAGRDLVIAARPQLRDQALFCGPDKVADAGNVEVMRDDAQIGEAEPCPRRGAVLEAGEGGVVIGGEEDAVESGLAAPILGDLPGIREVPIRMRGGQETWSAASVRGLTLTRWPRSVSDAP